MEARDQKHGPEPMAFFQSGQELRAVRLLAALDFDAFPDDLSKIWTYRATASRWASIPRQVMPCCRLKP
jgi:hypothetical protein